MSDEGRHRNPTMQRLILLALFAIAGAAWYAAIMWQPATWQLVQRGYSPLQSLGPFRTRASCEAAREWAADGHEGTLNRMACFE